MGGVAVRLQRQGGGARDTVINWCASAAGCLKQQCAMLVQTSDCSQSACAVFGGLTSNRHLLPPTQPADLLEGGAGGSEDDMEDGGLSASDDEEEEEGNDLAAGGLEGIDYDALLAAGAAQQRKRAAAAAASDSEEEEEAASAAAAKRPKLSGRAAAERAKVEDEHFKLGEGLAGGVFSWDVLLRQAPRARVCWSGAGRPLLLGCSASKPSLLAAQLSSLPLCVCNPPEQTRWRRLCSRRSARQRVLMTMMRRDLLAAMRRVSNCSVAASIWHVAASACPGWLALATCTMPPMHW